MTKEPLAFKVIPIKDEPKRKYVKGSKYDPMLDSFVKSGHPLVKIEVTKPNSSELLDANYLRTQLSKRIVIRELKTVKAMVINSICHLKIVEEAEATE